MKEGTMLPPHGDDPAESERTSHTLNHVDSVYYLHIPKTAGTSLTKWLGETFAVSKHSLKRHAYEFVGADVLEFRQKRFFAGHMGHAFTKRFENSLRPKIVTLLREPVAREISQLRYLRAFDNEQIHRYGEKTWARLVHPANKYSLRDLITSRSYRHSYDNLQVRFLTGSGPPIDCSRRLTTADFDVAKANLASLDAFGIVEDMERSAFLISAALGLPGLDESGHANVTRESGSNTYTDDDLDAFGDVNTLDAELYRFSLALFEERFSNLLTRAGMSGYERVRLSAFLDHVFITTDRGVERLSSADFDVSDGVVCRGWHDRFYYAPLDKWIRWARSGVENTLFLPIDRTADRHISFRIPFTTSIPVRDGIAISSGGFPLRMERKFEKWNDDSWHMLIVAHLPGGRSFLDNQYTDITFQAPLEGVGESGRSFALSNIRIR
jgi:hypothetical protein